MCFSATASFLASGGLFALGSASVALAMRKQDRQTLPLALAPLIFAGQQALEGVVWLGLDGTPPPAGAAPTLTVVATVAYLFFAYAFWPVWMPWAAVSLRPHSSAGKGLWRGLPLLGLVPGLLLWLPLLSHPRSALPIQLGHTLVYPLNPWSQHLLPPFVGPALYAALIVLPLFLAPSWRVRAFALTLLLTFGLTEWASRQALTSLWCYASALLSGQILWILWQAPPPAETLPVALAQPQA